MPKVWGDSPIFYLRAFGDGWTGHAEITSRFGDRLDMRAAYAHPTQEGALRAIRKLWRETFGGWE